MPSDVIPIGFDIVPTGIRAKKHPKKCAKCLSFSLLPPEKGSHCFLSGKTLMCLLPREGKSSFFKW